MFGYSELDQWLCFAYPKRYFFSCTGKSCSQLLQAQKTLPSHPSEQRQSLQPCHPPPLTEEPGGRGRQRGPQDAPKTLGQKEEKKVNFPQEHMF